MVNQIKRSLLQRHLGRAFDSIQIHVLVCLCHGRCSLVFEARFSQTPLIPILNSFPGEWAMPRHILPSALSVVFMIISIFILWTAIKDR